MAIMTLTSNDMLGTILGKMALCWLAGLLLLTVVYIVALVWKRFDLVDTAWGLTFIAIATAAFIIGPYTVGLNPATAVMGMVYAWGLRLAWHIGRRFLRSTSTDERYVELMKKWRGNRALNAYLRIYIVQSLLALLVSIPVIHICISQEVSWNVWMVLGVAVWVVGFVCEVVADAQLRHFLARPENRGKLMTKGLWKYARYPNYFGELTMWWGIALMALGTAHGWVGLGGAAVITYLIVYISGIPPKEARLRKREGWRQYINNSRLLLPLPK
ncbi:DUF1295 domain-containing protein [Candidatus Saccharibacteria bacterium]|nr:MAG: DUF1295 domain-containing protein [Candidatus Saccharibacteria bacterium]